LGTRIPVARRSADAEPALWVQDVPEPGSRSH